jgi:hypothetical protein
MINDIDLQKSWAIIDRLQPCEIYDLDKIDEDRMDLFIRCIKQRIDTLKDCEFSNNYKKVKKLNLF